LFRRCEPPNLIPLRLCGTNNLGASPAFYLLRQANPSTLLLLRFFPR